MKNLLKLAASAVLGLSLLFMTVGCTITVENKSKETVCDEHEYEPATCTEPRICKVCGKTRGDAKGHTWVDATCTAPKTCSVCNETDGESLGHTYTEEITVDPTCISSGEKTFICDACGDSYTEELIMTEYSAEEIHDLTKASICEITTYDKNGSEYSIGTGFVYSDDGEIITNYHVIDGGYSAKLTIDGKTYDVKYVLAYDTDIDLAVLKVNASGLTPLTICENDHAVGKPVYAFGSSQGLTDTFSQGIITYSSRLDGDVEYVQHDAAISSGNSGGPLINQFCEVIGINTLTFEDSQNLNFAVSVRELDNLTYGTKMTIDEVYEAESDPFVDLASYIIFNGDYNDSYGEYEIELADESSDSSQFVRLIDYNPDEYIVSLYLFLISDDVTSTVYIEFDDSDGTYDWGYYDDYDYEMSGVLYANTYDDDTLLGYNYNTLPDADTRKECRELASLMIAYLCTNLDSDLSAAGLEAEDFGFYNY